MPTKRSPVKGTKGTPKTKKVKTPRAIVPGIRSRDSSAGSSHSVPKTPPIVPPIAGISPDFMAFMQMQERMRMEERAIMERQRKEDKELAEQERFHQQKAHEAQMQLLQAQLEAMSNRSESNNKSSSKMPIFDMVKAKDTSSYGKLDGTPMSKATSWTKSVTQQSRKSGSNLS